MSQRDTVKILSVISSLFILMNCSGGGGKGKGGGGGISSPSSGAWEFDPADLSGAPSCFANDVDSSIELVHPKCKKGGAFVSDDQCDASTKPDSRPKTAAGTLQWTHNDPTPAGILSVLGSIGLLNGSASLTCSDYYDARFDSSFTGSSIVFDCGSAGSADDNHYIPSLTRGSQVFYCASKVVQVSAGNFHTCALTSAGAVYCWGWNGNGQLGIGNNDDKNSPTQVSPPSSVTFSSVSAGHSHTCALAHGGQIYCWGNNGNGQLGIGNNDDKNSPTQVSPPSSVTFSSVSAGLFHTCALTDSGVAYCWGWNNYGQLGIGNNDDKNSPTQVTGSHNFASISAGSEHTCATTTVVAGENIVPGPTYCWGRNLFGQLGIGSFGGQQNSPNQVSAPPSVTFSSVSAGDLHTCALTSAGQAYCWGYNWNGQLGIENITNQDSPTQVAGSHNFASISAGSNHTCAITSAGVAYCWGSNGSGQLGIGSSGGQQNSPTQVNAPSSVAFSSVSASDLHACALTSAGEVYCWGWNYYGQLGIGNNDNKNSPVLTNLF